MADAFDYAEDALNLWLLHNEKEHKAIPTPSQLESIKVPAGATIALVRADTLAYARANDTKAVRKSVSMPAWLDTMAKEHNLNLSNLLQNAVRRELNLA